VVALRRGLLVAFVVGLCCSITLCEGALILLTLLWLWRLCDPAVRAAQTWPLGRPVLAFAAATLLSAFASGHVAASLAASKGLLLMAALYVTADALEDAADGDRFVSWLGLAAAGAALASLVQVLACPSPEGAFYLWVPAPDGDAWSFTERLAKEAGVLVSPGEFYGPDGAGHVRVAVVQPTARLERAASRMRATS